MWDRALVNKPGRVAQSVTCLAADTCLTADPGVSSSFSAQSKYVSDRSSRGLEFDPGPVPYLRTG